MKEREDTNAEIKFDISLEVIATVLLEGLFHINNRLFTETFSSWHILSSFTDYMTACVYAHAFLTKLP